MMSLEIVARLGLHRFRGGESQEPRGQEAAQARGSGDPQTELPSESDCAEPGEPADAHHRNDRAGYRQSFLPHGGSRRGRCRAKSRIQLAAVQQRRQLAKEESSVELLLSKRVDGILLTKAAEDFRPSLRQMIKEVNIPFVLVMRTYPKLTKDAVITDDYQGAYDAVCSPGAFRKAAHRIDRRTPEGEQRAGALGGFSRRAEGGGASVRSGIGDRRRLPDRIRISRGTCVAFSPARRNLCGEPSYDHWDC